MVDHFIGFKTPSNDKFTKENLETATRNIE